MLEYEVLKKVHKWKLSKSFKNMNSIGEITGKFPVQNWIRLFEFVGYIIDW